MNEPIFSNLNTKCSSVSCTWTWDATGSIAGFPAWYSVGDPCGANGCAACNYPSFQGSADGETTITYCS